MGLYDQTELCHTGTPHEGFIPHSGRYPYGSGENPHQRVRDFLGNVEALQKKGLKESEIAAAFGMTVDQLRKQKSISKDQLKKGMLEENRRLAEEGLNRSERARKLGVSESTLRSWESEKAVTKAEQKQATIDLVREAVEKQGAVDIGAGVASSLGITSTRLETAVAALEEEGYTRHTVNIERINNPGKYIKLAVLSKPDVEWKDLKEHPEQIGVIGEKFESKNGTTHLGIKEPRSIKKSEMMVRYDEDGGSMKDGIIELRPGVSYLDLGNNHYAQVRISVEGTHYLKGVAVYNDDMPDGVNVIFNTNKKKGTPELGPKDNTVLKPIKDDPDNPFGSTIKAQKGSLNIVSEEGDWQEWSKTLSSQFLSKQSATLAKQQLTLRKKEMEAEYDEIMSLTNPTVKKALLVEFSEKADTAAVHLKAAAMPGQSNSVILPINSLKPNEVYAPNYKNGTEVILIRHPHGGTFEIPQLKVNNRNAEGKKIIGTATDAIGIHHSVAGQLSGADFDGDTVIVIPNDSKRIKARQAFKELQEFDPKIYKMPADKPGISPSYKQKQMGVVSNLITDMTIKGAPDEDIIKAVKHSMVVIDSEKHHLDYKQSAIDNEIDRLKRTYQQRPSDDGTEKYGGASTIISRAKSEVRVNERRQVTRIDPETGEKIFLPTNRSYVDKKTGKTVFSKETSTQMREEKDAFNLVSTMDQGRGMAMERVYAQYANDMKALGNKARKSSLEVVENPRNPESRVKYKEQVESLTAKLTTAKAWSPKERNAQIFANQVYKAKLQEDPDMSSDTKKKIRTQALNAGRDRLGGKKPTVDFTDKEWEAIQNNAISKTMLTELIRYADSDKVRERSMPKTSTGIPASKLAIAKAWLNSGRSYQEVAKALGVSVSTLQRAVK